jgi:hypothetical protein
MLFREIITDHTENHKEHYIHCGQNEEILIAETCGTCSYHWPSEV